MEKFYTLFLDYGFCNDGMQLRGGTLIPLVPSITCGHNPKRFGEKIYSIPYTTLDFQECPSYSVAYGL